MQDLSVRAARCRPLNRHLSSLRDTSLDTLLDTTQRLERSMWADSTLQCLEEMKNKIIKFNQRFYPSHPDSRASLPRFTSARVENASSTHFGQLISEHVNARIFFSQFETHAQSTLTGYRWQIQQIYSSHNFGPVPWDVKSGNPEAPLTHKFIDRLISKSRPPQPHTPLDHSVYSKLVHFWRAGGASPRTETTTTFSSTRVRRNVHAPVGSIGPVSTFAMAAAACFLRGTAARPQDLVRLRYSYVHDRHPDGFEFVYPQFDPVTNKAFTRKGHNESAARTLLMPERLDDGLDIAETFR